MRDLQIAYDQSECFHGTVDTLSLILAVTTITGFHVHFFSDKISFIICYLLDSSLYFITFFDVVFWFGWINYTTVPTSPTWPSDPIQLLQPCSDSSVSGSLTLPSAVLCLWALDNATPLQGQHSEVAECSSPPQISIHSPQFFHTHWVFSQF